MVNEYGFTRTNYFQINDLDEFAFLMRSVVANELEVLLRDYHVCFRCSGEIQGIDGEFFSDGNINLEDFLESLQHLLPDGEALILVYTGSISSKDMEAYYYVVTNTQIVYKEIFASTVDTAKSMTNNAAYSVCY